MKQILFISYCHNPFEHNTGGEQRSNLLLRACLQGAEVDFIAFRKMNSNIDGVNVLYAENHTSHEFFTGLTRSQKLHSIAKPWDLQRIFPVEKDLEQIVDSFVAKKHYDYIVVRYLPNALSLGLMKYAERLVVDIDDHPQDVIRNFTRNTRRFNQLYFRTISLFANIGVRNVAKRLQTSFYSNPSTPHYKRGILLPNVPFYEMPSNFADFATTTPRVLFVGTLDFQPNYQGICSFLENVWPLVRKAVPDAELHIVGATCNKEIENDLRSWWESYPGVAMLGFVDDLSHEYRDCRATVVPLYSGAGTSIKTLESMQQKRPCVSTPCGVRGYEKLFNDGSEVLVARNFRQFARLIVQAITNPTLNRTISEKAYHVVSQCFTKESFSGIVAKSLFEK